MQGRDGGLWEATGRGGFGGLCGVAISNEYQGI